MDIEAVHPSFSEHALTMETLCRIIWHDDPNPSIKHLHMDFGYV